MSLFNRLTTKDLNLDCENGPLMGLFSLADYNWRNYQLQLAFTGLEQTIYLTLEDNGLQCFNALIELQDNESLEIKSSHQAFLEQSAYQTLRKLCLEYLDLWREANENQRPFNNLAIGLRIYNQTIEYFNDLAKAPESACLIDQLR